MVAAELEPVFGGHPKDRHQRVKRPRVDVLKAMPPVPWFEWAESHDGVHVNVFIQAIDVGEGVVKDVVLDFPNHGVSPNEIENPANPKVDPFFVAVGVVVGVVHDVHADASKTQAHHKLHDPKQPTTSQRSPGKQHPWNKIHGDHHRSFQVKPPIPFATEVALLEISVDPRTEGFGEVRGVPAVANDRNLHWAKVESQIRVRPIQSTGCQQSSSHA